MKYTTKFILWLLLLIILDALFSLNEKNHIVIGLSVMSDILIAFSFTFFNYLDNKIKQQGNQTASQ